VVSAAIPVRGVVRVAVGVGCELPVDVEAGAGISLVGSAGFGFGALVFVVTFEVTEPATLTATVIQSLAAGLSKLSTVLDALRTHTVTR
jgi:hypothetical protein